MKNSRSYLGGVGYAGPTCAQAGVTPGKIYDTEQEAQIDADLLSFFNPIGFYVTEYK